MSGSSGRINPPSDYPGYKWEPMTANSAVPEHATYYGEEYLEGDGIRIGRVYDGNCLYVGTAIPAKGVCIYLNKDLEVKSSPNYEIISVDYYPRVNFRDINAENSKLEFGNEIHTHYDWDLPQDMTYWSIMVPAGVDETGEALGVVSHVENGGNTYYGWIKPSTKKAFIPRDASKGPQVLEKDFSVMLRGGIPRSALFRC